MRMNLCLSLLVGGGAALAGCSGSDGTGNSPPEESDSGNPPNVLPIDTSFFVPDDTAEEGRPDLTPGSFLFLRHIGSWELAGNPYDSLTGTLRVVEALNELPPPDSAQPTGESDTAAPFPFTCEVEYALTGKVVGDHTCGTACDFVFEVEHYVTTGAPDACRVPDMPDNGAVWQLGYRAAEEEILYNYFGTDVWLPWYNTTSAPPSLDFAWEFTLAVELEDTAEP